MKLKKLLFSTFTAILCTGLLFGCGSSSEDQNSDSPDEQAEEEESRKIF